MLFIRNIIIAGIAFGYILGSGPSLCPSREGTETDADTEPDTGQGVTFIQREVSVPDSPDHKDGALIICSLEDRIPGVGLEGFNMSFPYGSSFVEIAKQLQNLIDRCEISKASFWPDKGRQGPSYELWMEIPRVPTLHIIHALTDNILVKFRNKTNVLPEHWDIFPNDATIDSVLSALRAAGYKNPVVYLPNGELPENGQPLAQRVAFFSEGKPCVELFFDPDLHKG